ncbi:hypothetical protein RB195_010754 [Necator americanus]|uniref:Endonuclease/exonuclease/phosphatase domain-containing protein n=1 Tax=Necator americanus TaxID=51031 RepID=A0ABR1D0L5_NECAM
MAQNIDSSNNSRPESDVAMKMGPHRLDYLRRLRPTSSYEEESRSFIGPEKSPRRSAFYKVIIGDFNAKVGPKNAGGTSHGTHGLQWNDQGRGFRVHQTTKTIQELQSRSPPLRWTWESPGGGTVIDRPHHRQKRFCRRMSLLYQSSIRDRTIASSEEDFLHAESRESRQVQQENPRTTINWDPSLDVSRLWEDSAMDNIDEEYDRLVKHLMTRKKARVLKQPRDASLKPANASGAARAAGNQELTSSRKACRGEKKDLKGEEQKCGKQQRRKTSAMPPRLPRKTRMTARNPKGTTIHREGEWKIITTLPISHSVPMPPTI